ncbi:Gfo/Idh/MocA family oxidoreductase [Dethiosulfovibrio sp. F2B]|uniref:Gfo/Idh/MocA family protein n=1 Tax=Dethiosulfovibrio faecalis TaxID=2720018 RepID=UPI001F22744E|nr:Gfo/Idh/MocA family oxidoreductase [Dethiosulfovibrio faecalis]MCF4151120.1 Gfo/Idh/MocA family oxidoreductase [Dethiosulfovibrio faecalis]
MHNIAILGCGRISASHVAAIEKVSELKLVACCDILEDRAAETAAKTGCTAYTDYEKMLEKEGIDMIALCTPSGMHPDHAVTAAKAGVNVLSEKPLGTSLEKVDRAIEACDRAKVLYMEVKQNRLNPTIVLLRQALEAGRFGRIHMITSNVLWTRPQDYYDMAPWRGTWEFDGGCLANQAAHYVDMVQWMGGAVEQVHAFSSTLGRRIEAEDTITVGLKFRNGAVGNINVSVLTYPRNLEGSITVMGEKGTVKIGGVAMNKIDIWEFDSPHPMDDEVESTSYDPKSVYGGGHYVLYRDLPGMLDGTSKSYGFVTAREGRKTVEVLERVYS